MGPAWAVWGRKAGLLGLRGAGRGLVGTPRTQARGGGARGVVRVSTARGSKVTSSS